MPRAAPSPVLWWSLGPPGQPVYGAAAVGETQLLPIPNPFCYRRAGMNDNGVSKPTGRPPKGPRRFVATRLPVPVADALEDRAIRAGLTVTDALHQAVEKWLQEGTNGKTSQ